MSFEVRGTTIAHDLCAGLSPLVAIEAVCQDLADKDLDAVLTFLDREKWRRRHKSESDAPDRYYREDGYVATLHDGRRCTHVTVADQDMCFRHYTQLWDEMFALATSDSLGATTLPEPYRSMNETAFRWARLDRLTNGKQKMDDDREQSGFVYYLDVPGRGIKIGCTSNLPNRLATHKGYWENAVLLAVEHGWRKCEKRRHMQFRQARIGRQELFRPTRALRAHISRLAKETP